MAKKKGAKAPTLREAFVALEKKLEGLANENTRLKAELATHRPKEQIGNTQFAVSQDGGVVSMTAAQSEAGDNVAEQKPAEPFSNPRLKGAIHKIDPSKPIR